MIFEPCIRGVVLNDAPTSFKTGYSNFSGMLLVKLKSLYKCEYKIFATHSASFQHFTISEVRYVLFNHKTSSRKSIPSVPSWPVGIGL